MYTDWASTTPDSIGFTSQTAASLQDVSRVTLVVDNVITIVRSSVWIDEAILDSWWVTTCADNYNGEKMFVMRLCTGLTESDYLTVCTGLTESDYLTVCTGLTESDYLTVCTGLTESDYLTVCTGLTESDYLTVCTGLTESDYLTVCTGLTESDYLTVCTGLTESDYLTVCTGLTESDYLTGRKERGRLRCDFTVCTLTSFVLIW